MLGNGKFGRPLLLCVDVCLLFCLGGSYHPYRYIYVWFHDIKQGRILFKRLFSRLNLLPANPNCIGPSQKMVSTYPLHFNNIHGCTWQIENHLLFLAFTSENAFSSISTASSAWVFSWALEKPRQTSSVAKIRICWMALLVLPVKVQHPQLPKASWISLEVAPTRRKQSKHVHPWWPGRKWRKKRGATKGEVC